MGKMKNGRKITAEIEYRVIKEERGRCMNINKNRARSVREREREKWKSVKRDGNSSTRLPFDSLHERENKEKGKTTKKKKKNKQKTKTEDLRS